MTVLPYSLMRLSALRFRIGTARHILAELLNLLDLGRELVGEGVLQGLDDSMLALIRSFLGGYRTLALAEE
jgi:hypothetical protein